MRMSTLFKGVGSIVVVGVAYIDKTLSPLFWVLLALVILDVLLNLKDESKQLQKLGSMFFAVGIPAYLENNAGHLMNPDVLKALVALLSISYIRIVFPQIVALTRAFQFSRNAKQNAQDQAQALTIEQQVEAYLAQKAKDQAGSAAPANISQASTGTTGGN